MCHRLIEYLSTRNPQTLAELLNPPTNSGEIIAWWVWAILFFLAPPS